MSYIPQSTVTVKQPVATELKIDLSGTGANTNALIVDASGFTVPVSGTLTLPEFPEGSSGSQGGFTQLFTSDVDVREILSNILNELKKINLHMSTVTDDEIVTFDIE